MSDFYKVYMQKESDGSEVKETIADFGIYCADIPFSITGDAKEVTSRNWYDEDGLDEYIPANGLKISAYDMEVKFCCKGDKFSANTTIRKFLDYIIGKDGTGAMLKMYCDYTNIGRRHIRYVKMDDKAELVRDEDGDILVFSISFKVGDPITDITPTFDKGVIKSLS